MSKSLTRRIRFVLAWLLVITMSLDIAAAGSWVGCGCPGGIIGRIGRLSRCGSCEVCAMPAVYSAPYCGGCVPVCSAPIEYAPVSCSPPVSCESTGCGIPNCDGCCGDISSCCGGSPQIVSESNGEIVDEGSYISDGHDGDNMSEADVEEGAISDDGIDLVPADVVPADVVPADSVIDIPKDAPEPPEVPAGDDMLEPLTEDLSDVFSETPAEVETEPVTEDLPLTDDVADDLPDDSDLFGDTPATDTPAADTPAADTPAADTPATDTDLDDLFGDTPAADAPATDTPATPAADTDLDDLFGGDEAPAADATPADAPAADTTPAADTPAGGDTPAGEDEPADEGGIDDLFNDDEAPNGDALEDLFSGISTTEVHEVSLDASNSPIRAWADNTGLYETRGRLVYIAKDHIKLLKDNGKECTVQMRRLSKKDRQHVLKQANKHGLGHIQLARLTD